MGTELIPTDKPIVCLGDDDGNAFSILAKCRKAARKAEWSTNAWYAFEEQATSGDYDQLLTTVQTYFDVD